MKKFVKCLKRNFDKEDVMWFGEGLVFCSFLVITIYGLAFVGLIYK